MKTLKIWIIVKNFQDYYRRKLISELIFPFSFILHLFNSTDITIYYYSQKFLDFISCYTTTKNLIIWEFQK